jgi:formamidopyrimidine-DNA glycosylase
MPELPEVQTIITDLKKVLPGLKITGFWTDIPSFKKIKKEITGRKILKLERKGKNILIHLSGGITLLVHQKLTGHLLYGKWGLGGGDWKSKISGPLAEDPQNRFLHLILDLSNGKQLALSDLRKFAKVLVWPTEKLEELPDISKLGPDPLSPVFDFKKFKEVFANRKGKIKVVLMNQEIISGIGNIYSDEILWEAGIHPFKAVEKLNESDLKRIFNAMKKILKRAIEEKGDSVIDYRRPSGEKGRYQKIQNAYQMTGKKCRKNDGGIIKRIKIAGRSAHFCPVHQKL